MAVMAASLVASAQFSDPAKDIPAYNSQAPHAPLPPVLSGKQLTGVYFSHPYQVTAYKMAAQVPGVLFQQPCYCRCDRGMGHNSLHSCFEGLHGAECSTCMKEAAYTYRETKRGRSAAQIRAGIERGEFESIDLEHIAL
ncbi:CYCXC family (seleno)protein [Granulicella cerasi]|uniref:CYCXC family (Seleno)protein n=2 Tax=Granulicella cerasi TaxID=741063 RepID=A0ABW1Z5E6_9BACT